MSIKVALNHVSHYTFDRQVVLSPHVVRLRPAPHSRTPIPAYTLKVTPAEHFINWQQDPFGNYQARLVFPKPSRELKIEVDLVADLTAIDPFNFFVEESAEHFPFVYESALAAELAPYLAKGPAGRPLDEFVVRIRNLVARQRRRSIEVLIEINQLVQKTLRYDIRMEPGVFGPDETLTRGHGSCRDFAWLMVQTVRRLGFAARFVSGYSIQLRPDVKPLDDGPAGVAKDCTDLHAWVEVYLPGAGWVGFDATSGLVCGEGHIPLACTADPGSAAAITGAVGWDKQHDEEKLGEEFSFSMTVTRLTDPPRPTKPYTESQWQAILSCGDRVDEALVAQDVRLTMGGEPTFVSVDDREGEEWGIAALGPTKAGLADGLLKRLRRQFAKGGLLHHGQGKWYPGEPLPRWAYSCYFRRDGAPIWQDDQWTADGQGREGASPDVAREFLGALAERLQVDARHAQPGFEDAWYHLWKEQRLPVNVDPFDSRLDNEQDRARLRKVFEQGLKHTVGYALPLRVFDDGDDSCRWQSGPWFLRDERLYLHPGDSPMGYRLPLDSLPWVAKGDRENIVARDPFAARGPLPLRHDLSRPLLPSRKPGSLEGAGPERGKSAPHLIRTALCIEPRDGTLHLFMPPLATLESYLDLVTAIEDTASHLGMPVRLEGYHPPSDHRLNRFQITPDPGVIEVNVQPAASWRELVHNTSTLYEEARLHRLTAEKFMLDGRHTGTGGGNHVVLGGPTPADSPILRKPDLLRSLGSYWINHPSLSYLFSGMFIGPTSQAPRIDEARHDSLYELEIANGLLDGRTGQTPAPPWLTDRLYRNLLVDVTGNTHRTEMCIDKLFSPDSASGRQGLLELRAFEMPPDARMSCAQQLVVRALVAWFWRAPYTRPPVRWGTSLNDRFMLPHYVVKDFNDVLDDLRQAGFPLQPDWFTAQAEFRFPIYGQVTVGGIELELRQALEPWHVMGEEQGGGGTSRFVDSSVERVQVQVRGALGDRHIVTCNGRRVPLSPTDRREELVAGVRYRAWQPPSALHPTIGVHSPLRLDVIDIWAGRSLGGCTYHVAHPGGRAPDKFPTTALEAESRRASRFFAFGHTPGTVLPPVEATNPELPHTLDLRWLPRGSRLA